MEKRVKCSSCEQKFGILLGKKNCDTNVKVKCPKCKKIVIVNNGKVVVMRR